MARTIFCAVISVALPLLSTAYQDIIQPSTSMTVLTKVYNATNLVTMKWCEEKQMHIYEGKSFTFTVWALTSVPVAFLYKTFLSRSSTL